MPPRRRGAPSTNANDIERRIWYDKMLEGARQTQQDSLKSPPIFESSSIDSRDSLTRRDDNIAEELLPPAKDFVPIIPSFKSLTLSLGEESLERIAKMKDRGASFEEKDYIPEMIESLDPAINKRWITKLSSGSTRLVCFHDCGATAAQFSKWKCLQKYGIEVIVINLPGRYTRTNETVMNHILDISTHISYVLKSLHSSSPASRTVLFGHGLGAILAFETAVELHLSNGPPIDHLIALTAKNKDWKTRFVHKLSDRDLVHHLLDKQWIPESMRHRKDLLRIFLPNIRNDFRMRETYRLQKRSQAVLPLRCQLTTIHSELPDDIRHEDLSEWNEVVVNGDAIQRLRLEPEDGMLFSHSREDSVNLQYVYSAIVWACFQNRPSDIIHGISKRNDFE